MSRMVQDTPKRDLLGRLVTAGTKNWKNETVLHLQGFGKGMILSLKASSQLVSQQSKSNITHCLLLLFPLLFKASYRF